MSPRKKKPQIDWEIIHRDMTHADVPLRVLRVTPPGASTALFSAALSPSLEIRSLEALREGPRYVADRHIDGIVAYAGRHDLLGDPDGAAIRAEFRIP